MCEGVFLMRIQSMHNYNQQSFNGKIIRSKPVEKAIEYSAMRYLNDFYKYLEKMNKHKDGLVFTIQEKLTKSDAPNFIKRVLTFNIKTPNYSRTFTTSDEWPENMESTNYDYSAALFYVNSELEHHYYIKKDNDLKLNREELTKKIYDLLA